MNEPVKIIAVVRFNKGEAYVFNRQPAFLFEKSDKKLIAKDGPFEARYHYEKPTPRWQAFAGRKFNIPMLDGSKVEASGQWWHCVNPNLEHITYETVEGLLRCYVFVGCDAEPEAIAKLRAEYDGPVYPYYDYEAVITSKPDRIKHYQQVAKLERDKRNLIKQVKTAHAKIHKLTD